MKINVYSGIDSASQRFFSAEGTDLDSFFKPFQETSVNISKSHRYDYNRDCLTQNARNFGDAVVKLDGVSDFSISDMMYITIYADHSLWQDGVLEGQIIALIEQYFSQSQE